MGIEFINPFMTAPAPQPLFQSSTGTAITTASTSYALNMPTGIVVGELLFAVLVRNTTSGSVTWPAGWTELEDAATSKSLSYAYRIADGTEGTTITVTSTNSVTAVAIIARIANHASSVSAPVDGTAATGTSTSPNPPNVAHSWGTGPWTMFLTVLSANTNVTVSADSSGYTLGAQNALSTNARVRIAYKVAKAASDDPGTMTLASSQNWRVNTVAIRGLG